MRESLKLMIEPAIKSRPVYPGLKPDRCAKSNVVVVDKDGRDAFLEMAKTVDDGFLRKTTVLFVKGPPNGHDPAAPLEALGLVNLWVFPSLETLIARLDGLLSISRMGTRLYAAGNEPLISLVVKTALSHGVVHSSIMTEHRGSLRRRVQCVHCKGITENVTTNPAKCSHCGLMILVREDYSRRIGAFQGVCIDAEVPGEIPEIKAEFL
jgi:hypothetical protein